jgi:uncharacterized protein (TIGR03435 family)
MSLRTSTLVVAALTIATWLRGIPVGRSQELPQGTPGTAAQPAFEVATVKPSGERGRALLEASHGNLTIRFYRLTGIISWAYGVPSFQLKAPDWANQSRFEIVAKAAGPVPEEQVRLMLRRLLAERFKLTLHQETNTFEVQALTVGKNGPRLTPSDVEGPPESQNDPAKGRITFKRTTLAELAGLLSGGGSRTLDRTGLAGRYDFVLDYGRFLDSTDPSGMPAFNAALREAIPAELGLKLEAKSLPLDVLVVDHLEKVPVEN